MSQILNVQFGGQQLAVDFGESTALAMGSASAAGVSATAAAADRVLAQAAATAVAGQAKSANTIALIAAIRTNGFFPGLTQRLATNDIPVITLGAGGGNSTINAQTGGNNTVGLSSGKLNFVSGPSRLNGPYGIYRNSRGTWSGASYFMTYSAVEFNHIGTALEIVVGGNGDPGSNVRLLVNGIVAGTVAVPNGTGVNYYLKLVFPASGTRRIRFEGGGVPTYGVNVVSTAEVALTGRTYPTISIMADSFGEGTGASQGPINGEATILGNALGADIALAASGGTGMLNPGSRVNFGDTTRMVDLTLAGVTDATTGVAANPLLGIVMASQNDQGNITWATYQPTATSFQEAITLQTHKIIAAWQAARSGKPLMFFGPTWPNGDPVMDIYRIRDGVQQAVEAAGGASANLWFIDRLNPAPTLRYGANSYVQTTGNTVAANGQITGMATLAGISAGAGIEGTGIPAGARVISLDSATAITIDGKPTATATAVALTFRATQSSVYGFGPSDSAHPGQAGHNLDGLWMAKEARRLILSELA